MEVSSYPILQFQDYRAYLRRLFELKQQINARFSFRRFAVIVGFKSPNYLQMILDGRRNLSEETAAQIAVKLKMKTGERDYFVALVQGANAKTDVDRAAAERSRLIAIRKILSKDIAQAHQEVFAKWHYLLVRELFFVRGAKADPAWISQMLGNCIRVEEAKQAVELLVRCGFLVQTSKGLKPHDPVLQSDDQMMQAAFLRTFHADTLRVWAQNLERLGPHEQELGVLNIPIDSRKLPELRARINAFQDEIIGWVQSEANADRVVQLGTYLIPFDSNE